jgi:hypothetical protein
LQLRVGVSRSKLLVVVPSRCPNLDSSKKLWCKVKGRRNCDWGRTHLLKRRRRTQGKIVWVSPAASPRAPAFFGSGEECSVHPRAEPVSICVGPTSICPNGSEEAAGRWPPPATAQCTRIAASGTEGKSKSSANYAHKPTRPRSLAGVRRPSRASRRPQFAPAASAFVAAAGVPL